MWILMGRSSSQNSSLKRNKDRRYPPGLLARNKAKDTKMPIKHTSLGYIERMYSKYPRIDKNWLSNITKDWLPLPAVSEPVPQTILHDGEEKQNRNLNGGWICLVKITSLNCNATISKQRSLTRHCAEVCKIQRTCYCCNDSHYTDQDDYNAHDILLCINTDEEKYAPVWWFL